MRRFFSVLLVALACMITMLASAGTPKVPNSDIIAKSGVRAKFSMATTRTVSEITDWGPGGMAGIAGYYPIGKIVYFSPGLLIGCQTVKLDGVAWKESSQLYFDGNMNIIGTEIPLDLGFNIFHTNDFRFSAFTGPQIHFNFTIKAKYDMKKPGSDVVYRHHNRTIDEFRGFELGWGFGLALDYKSHWHIQAGADIGLTTFAKMERVYVDEWASFKRLGFSIGLGYNFW